MKRFRIPLLVLAALAFMWFTFDWAVGAIIHSRKTVIVPNLMGRSVSEAVSLVSPLGLGILKEGEQFDKTSPAGTILRQNPAKDMTVREGRLIRITVSQGGETLYVPDLIGQPMRQAQILLQNSGLTIGEVERKPSLRFEKDAVMATDPPARAVTSKGALIGVTVSEGPPAADTTLMPDFIGRLLPEVRRWAQAHQVSVAVRDETNVSRSAGEILQQVPTADTPVRAGDSLTLVVNSGDISQTPAGSRRIYFEVPPGSSDRDIRVMVIDEAGEKEVYRKAHAPGSRLDLVVQPQGRARARIFVNGIMAEEQELQ